MQISHSYDKENQTTSAYSSEETDPVEDPQAVFEKLQTLDGNKFIFYFINTEFDDSIQIFRLISDFIIANKSQIFTYIHWELFFEKYFQFIQNDPENTISIMQGLDIHRFILYNISENPVFIDILEILFKYDINIQEYMKSNYHDLLQQLFNEEGFKAKIYNILIFMIDHEETASIIYDYLNQIATMINDENIVYIIDLTTRIINKTQKLDTVFQLSNLGNMLLEYLSNNTLSHVSMLDFCNALLTPFQDTNDMQIFQSVFPVMLHILYQYIMSDNYYKILDILECLDKMLHINYLLIEEIPDEITSKIFSLMDMDVRYDIKIMSIKMYLECITFLSDESCLTFLHENLGKYAELFLNNINELYAHFKDSIINILLTLRHILERNSDMAENIIELLLDERFS